MPPVHLMFREHQGNSAFDAPVSEKNRVSVRPRDELCEIKLD